MRSSALLSAKVELEDGWHEISIERWVCQFWCKISDCYPELGLRRRTEIAQEIIVTERAYLTKLRTLQDVYMKPLRMSMANANETISSLISEHQFKVIFFEIEAIYFYNSEFLQNMEKRMKNFNPQKSKFADIFVMLVWSLFMSFI